MAVKIEDVAKAAGTSKSTVSKALNNSYTISEETKARVRQAAERLGYRPNVNARALGSSMTHKAIFLTNLEPNLAFNSPHMYEIISGAESELRRRGFALQLLSCTADEAPQVVKDIFEGKVADGLIVYSSILTKGLSLSLVKGNTPHIIIGRSDFSAKLCWVDTNNELAGEIAARHLIEQGYGCIAYIGGLSKDKISEARLRGILAVMEDENRELHGIEQGESTVEESRAMAQTLLASESIPDAIICANNYIAIGCLRAINRSGLRVPRDIGVITFDDYPFAHITEPPLTAVNIDVFGLGIHAAKMLISKIKHPEQQIQTYITQPKLIIRESTRSR